LRGIEEKQLATRRRDRGKEVPFTVFEGDTQRKTKRRLVKTKEEPD